MRFVFAIILALGLGACTSPIDTRRTLHAAGYTDVVVGSYSLFACGEGDFYATKWKAVNPQGQQVSGTVCCGLFFKNCTIRF